MATTKGAAGPSNFQSSVNLTGVCAMAGATASAMAHAAAMRASPVRPRRAMSNRRIDRLLLLQAAAPASAQLPSNDHAVIVSHKQAVARALSRARPGRGRIREAAGCRTDAPAEIREPDA